jgi:outer membrane protein W
MAVRIGLFLGVLALAPSVAWGQILSVELRSTGMLAHTEDNAGHVRFKDAVGAGTAITYGYRDRAIELSMDVVPVNVDGGKLDGRVIMMPVMVSGYFRFHPFGRRWFPYIGAGVGVILTNLRESEGVEYNVAVADPIALQAALGFQYFIVKNWAATWQVRYLHSRAKLELSPDGGSTQENDDISLSTFIGTFGISKYF